MALTTCTLVGIALLVLGAAIWLRLLPTVEDAPARVSAILTVHHASAVTVPVPPRIGDAVVAIEDRRFYINHGLDPVSVARIAWGLLSGGSLDSGGATISQQLAKLLYAPADQTVRAKLEVAGLAIKLDHRYSKQQIRSESAREILTTDMAT